METNKYMTEEEANSYVHQFGKIKSYFTQEAIAAVLNSENGTLKKFSKIEYVKEGTNRFYETLGYHKVASHVIHSMTKTTWYAGHEWERQEDEWCDEWLVSSPWSHEYCSFLKALVEYDYPWTKKYSINCYELQYGDTVTDEFYVTIPGEHLGAKDEILTLYVPYTAMKEHDPGMVYERMIQYFGQYYSGRPEMLERALSVFKRDTTNRFLQEMKGE